MSENVTNWEGMARTPRQTLDIPDAANVAKKLHTYMRASGLVPQTLEEST